MMQQLLYSITLLLLTLLTAIPIHHVLSAGWQYLRRRSHLPNAQNSASYSAISAEPRLSGSIYRHIALVLESIRSGMRASHFILLTFILFLLGLWCGLVVFLTIKGMLLLGCMTASAPYLWLRIKLLNMQMNSRLEFLPAVEVLYQHYLHAEGRNFRNILQQALLENRIRYPIKAVFDQLYRNLSADRGVEHSLKLFAMSLGHVWAGYLANMISVSITEGADIRVNLQELITDMRRAQRASQSERNKLLEIRLANYSPLLFLGVFLFVNFRLNYEQSYRFYIVDPAGRNMLLEAIVLIFASFVMGFYLSQRKM